MRTPERMPHWSVLPTAQENPHTGTAAFWYDGHQALEEQRDRFGVESEKGFKLEGAGMGNPNRLVSTVQAIEKASENGVTDFSDLLLISDAFFPFRDNVDLAHQHGIRKIRNPVEVFEMKRSSRLAMNIP